MIKCDKALITGLDEGKELKYTDKGINHAVAAICIYLILVITIIGLNFEIPESINFFEAFGFIVFFILGAALFGYIGYSLGLVHDIYKHLMGE